MLSPHPGFRSGKPQPVSFGPPLPVLGRGRLPSCGDRIRAHDMQDVRCFFQTAGAGRFRIREASATPVLLFFLSGTQMSVSTSTGAAKPRFGTACPWRSAPRQSDPSWDYLLSPSATPAICTPESLVSAGISMVSYWRCRTLMRMPRQSSFMLPETDPPETTVVSPPRCR